MPCAGQSIAIAERVIEGCSEALSHREPGIPSGQRAGYRPAPKAPACETRVSRPLTVSRRREQSVKAATKIAARVVANDSNLNHNHTTAATYDTPHTPLSKITNLCAVSRFGPGGVRCGDAVRYGGRKLGVEGATGPRAAKLLNRDL